MASVSLAEASRAEGCSGAADSARRGGHCEHNTGTGAHPQQFLTHQQRRDSQAGGLVLPDNGIRA